MPCTYCNVQFTLTRWKSTCSDCLRKHCSECMIERKCLPCHYVFSSGYKRSRLMQLKVKDLRLYLKSRNCSTDTCKEKQELVRLVQFHVGVNEPDLENHTESYDTSFHTSQNNVGLNFQSDSDSHQQPSEAQQSNTSNARNESESAPNLSPPTYRQTQDSFPTARDFASTSTSTPQTTNNETATNSSTTKKRKLLDISEINSVEEIESLNIRQLKYLLSSNLVNYQGVLEKNELIKRVINLYEVHQSDLKSVNKGSNADTQSSSEVKDENLCKICWDNPVNCVYLECSHMVTCIDCSKAVKECPICRQHIVRKVRVFKS